MTTDEAREALVAGRMGSEAGFDDRVDDLIAAVRAETAQELAALREAADALVRHYDGEDCNGDCETVAALRAALAATPAEPTPTQKAAAMAALVAERAATPAEDAKPKRRRWSYHPPYDDAATPAEDGEADLAAEYNRTGPDR